MNIKKFAAKDLITIGYIQFSYLSSSLSSS